MPELAQEDFDLRRYADVVIRRKWQVLLVVVIVGAMAALYTVSQPTRYRATAEVLLRQSAAEQLLVGSGDLATSRQAQDPVNIQTEREYMRSRSVQDAARKALGFEPTVAIGAASQTDGESEVVAITATNGSARRAARAANVYAGAYTKLRREQLTSEYRAASERVGQQVADLTGQLHTLEAPLDAIDAQIAAAQSPEAIDLLVARRSATESDLSGEREPLLHQIDQARDRQSSLELATETVAKGGAQIISLAEVPSHPASPQPARNAVLALIIGLVLGIGVAFIREALDDRLQSVSGLEGLTGWPVLAVLPRQRRRAGADGRPANLAGLGQPTSEAFAMLRTALQFEARSRPLRVILVTSPLHGEGKTTTVANLGLALALDGNRVLLVDGDLRHHRLHEMFDVPNEPGFAGVVTGGSPLANAIVSVGGETLLSVLPNMSMLEDSEAIGAQRLLSILPAGSTRSNPAELLASKRAAAALDELRERFDYVLVDAPPVLPVSDVAVLAAHVDGVVLLTNDEVSRQGTIRRTARLLRQVDAPVVGTIINESPARRGDAYDYDGQYLRWDGDQPLNGAGSGRSRRGGVVSPR